MYSKSESGTHTHTHLNPLWSHRVHVLWWEPPWSGLWDFRTSDYHTSSPSQNFFLVSYFYLERQVHILTQTSYTFLLLYRDSLNFYFCTWVNTSLLPHRGQQMFIFTCSLINVYFHSLINKFCLQTTKCLFYHTGIQMFYNHYTFKTTSLVM